MSTSVEEFVAACFDELQLSQRFVPYIQKASDAGYLQLAKTFRALVASETAREALLRKGVPHHADEAGDFYVCPNCGLVFYLESPDQCPADETPGAKFIAIQ
jgi:rubrerythrin